MTFLPKAVVKAFIDGLVDNTIFSVVFEKKDGTLRRMVCRQGVTSYLKGGEATYDANPDNIGAFDTEAMEYRCFNATRVLRIKGGGATLLAGEIEAPIVNARGEQVFVT